MSRPASEESASRSRTAEDNAFEELVERDVALLLRRAGFAAVALADVDDIDDVRFDSGMGLCHSLQCVACYQTSTLRQTFNADSLGLDMQALTDFLRSNRTELLNVAGPRESKGPGVYQWTLTLLRF